MVLKFADGARSDAHRFFREIATAPSIPRVPQPTHRTQRRMAHRWVQLALKTPNPTPNGIHPRVPLGTESAAALVLWPPAALMPAHLQRPLHPLCSPPMQLLTCTASSLAMHARENSIHCSALPVGEGCELLSGSGRCWCWCASIPGGAALAA